jgi:hypothetical protein
MTAHFIIIELVMQHCFFFSQINEFMVINKNELFCKNFAEMDRLFSYTSSYELPDLYPKPDPRQLIRIRKKRPGSGSATGHQGHHDN